jgi:hypothetical protein
MRFRWDLDEIQMRLRQNSEKNFRQNLDGIKIKFRSKFRSNLRNLDQIKMNLNWNLDEI